MDAINIFLTDELAETLEGFEQAGTRFAFARLYPDGPRQLVDGPIWAFVDWVMDDLAGLEMCRRLRADPRTTAAHVTMVLESDDIEDRRRALRAGADDGEIAERWRAAMMTKLPGHGINDPSFLQPARPMSAIGG